MSFTNKSSFIAYMILVMLALFGPAGIIATFGGSSTVKAEQPKSAVLLYEAGRLQVYCEQPTGNMIYTIVYPIYGGAGIFVVPGGCK